MQTWLKLGIAAAGLAMVVPAAAASSYLFGFTTSAAGATLSVNGGTAVAAQQSGNFVNMPATGETGFHLAGNANYAVGSDGSTDARDYFVFGARSPATSAVLTIADPDAARGLVFGPGVASVTLTLYDVSTLSPTSAITATDYSARGDIFADLGTGVSFGSVTVSSYSPTVTIAFNQAGLDAINAAADGSGAFLFGGALTENVGVPEPATWALMLTGFGLTGAALRRRSAAAAA